MPRIDFALHPGVIVFIVLTVVAILFSVATTIYASLSSDTTSSDSGPEETSSVPPFVPERNRMIHHRMPTEEGKGERVTSREEQNGS